MQEFLFQVAIEIAGLLLLLLVASACVRWARRASFDRLKRCVRCGYPRGDDSAAPCAECGQAPIAGARARGLPTWRWPALWGAGACAGGAALLGATLVHRPHFYPESSTRSASWIYRYWADPSEVYSFHVSCQGIRWRMGYDAAFGDPSATSDRVDVDEATFQVWRKSDATTLATVSVHRSGSGWIVQEWSPIESDRATPAVGATVDAADLARWLVAQDFPPLPDQSERALRSAQVLLGGVPLSDLAFGRGPLSGLLGYGSDEANVTFVGVAGSDSGASITPLWNAVRWSATALVALALGGWALQLLVRGERSRRLVRDARG